MDTVIGNKYLEIFDSLDIEVSKKLEGEYEVDDVINTFKNFFFNKMILDITAIKDYKNIDNLKKLAMNINMEKVILFLDKDDDISNSNSFLSKLVNMGIYNFTSDSNSIMYLYNNPNSYKDVAMYQEDDNKEEIITRENDISATDTKNDKIVLGIKNVTSNAGATTLCFLLKKILSNYYNTLLVEIDKMDFAFLKDSTSINVKDGGLADVIKNDKYNKIDLFIVDLNRSTNYDSCTDVLYLIEPSTIKLNKLINIEPTVFKDLSDKKVVLNKLKLDDVDIANFEVESKLKVYYNIGAINDKKDNSGELIPLLKKLGYIKDNHSNIRGLFGFFKK